ncbi:MAG TPA: condensation domain-containing protein, partial [Thermoanaerobaculia bacterium]
PAVPSFRGGVVRRVLAAPSTAELQALGRREGVTLFMTLLAAWTIALSRFAGETDVVVGTNIANRHRGEFEDVIGCFVNTLALRTSLAGDPTCRELLGRVREVALGAYAHQDVPFEQVLLDLRPERHLDQAPLFQVMLVLQDVPLTTVTRFPGLAVTPCEHERRSASFDLTLYLWTDGPRLPAAIEYSTDLYDGEVAARLLDHFESFLQQLCADPGTRLSALTMAGEAEARKVLEGFGGRLDEE